jgi:SAM-dependent methyltransferase
LWAIDVLGVAGSDRLLEIGCGNGVAAALVCERLTLGRLTAIDRSAKAIATARQRNADHVAAGKAVFVESAFDVFSADTGAFDKVFAINVNLFWVDPARCLRRPGCLRRADACSFSTSRRRRNRERRSRACVRAVSNAMASSSIR